MRTTAMATTSTFPAETADRDASRRGRVLLIMLVAVVALAVGETLLSKGMKQIGRSGGGWLDQAMAIARNPWIGAGLLLLLIHVGLYMAALQGSDLSFALPLTAASYPMAALLARFYLREDVGTARWVGIVLITAGVAIVALGDGTSRLVKLPRRLRARRARSCADHRWNERPLDPASFASIRSSRSPTTLTFASSSGCQPHAKLTLDSHHQANDIHRVKTQRLAQVLIVLQERILLAHLFVEQIYKRGSKRLPG